MLYADNGIYNVNYNEKLDKLGNKKNRTIKLLSFFQKHKFITITAILFALFSVMNCTLIYCFMGLLKNI